MIEFLIALATAALLIALAIVSVIYAIARINATEDRKKQQLINRYTKLVEQTELLPIQKDWILSDYLPQLADYRHRSSASRWRFYALSKSAIVFPAIGVIASTLTATLFQEHWRIGLAVVGVVAAIGPIFSALEQIDRNSEQWRDYRLISDKLDDTLAELIVHETPDIPVSEQFEQFLKEHQLIRELESQLFSRRVAAAQQAAANEGQSAQNRLEQTRKEYKDKYANGTSAGSGFSGSDRGAGVLDSLRSDDDGFGSGSGEDRTGTPNLTARGLDNVGINLDSATDGANVANPTVDAEVRAAARREAEALRQKLEPERPPNLSDWLEWNEVAQADARVKAVVAADGDEDGFDEPITVGGTIGEELQW